MYTLRSIFLCFLLIGLMNSDAFSQVNIERMRLTEVDFLVGSVGGSFAVREGNVEFYSLGLNGRVDYSHGPHDAFLVGRVNLIQSNDNVLSYVRFGHARYNYDIKTFWQWEVFGQAEFDEIRLLNQRILVGTGLRFKIFQNDNNTVHLGSTPMFEVERLNPSAITDDPNTSVGRWSNYFSWRSVKSDLVSLVHTTYFQPRFDEPSDLRLLNDTSLDVKIFSNLSLGVVMNLRYDSRPPEGIKDFDLTLANTLKYSF